MPSVMLGLACPSRLLTTCTGTPACGPEGVLALARQHRRQGLRAAEAPRTCGVREPMQTLFGSRLRRPYAPTLKRGQSPSTGVGSRQSSAVRPEHGTRGLHVDPASCAWPTGTRRLASGPRVTAAWWLARHRDGCRTATGQEA